MLDETCMNLVKVLNFSSTKFLYLLLLSDFFIDNVLSVESYFSLNSAKAICLFLCRGVCFIGFLLLHLSLRFIFSALLFSGIIIRMIVGPSWPCLNVICSPNYSHFSLRQSLAFKTFPASARYLVLEVAFTMNSNAKRVFAHKLFVCLHAMCRERTFVITHCETRMLL